MRKLLIILAVFVSGWTTLQNWIPSFCDANQSAKIVDVRVGVERIDCSRPQLEQILPVQANLQWFQVYSKTKGMTQGDVLRVVDPIKKIVDEWVERGDGSRGYCTIKRKLLLEQTERAAVVIQGRW